MNSNGVEGSTPRRRKVEPAFLLFVGVTTVLSGVVAIAASSSDQLWITALIPIVPGAAAAGLLVWNRQVDTLKALARSLVDASVDRNWWLVSILLFPAIALVAVGIYAITGSTDVRFGSPRLAPAIVAIPLMLANEYGWRGYASTLFPRRTSAFTKSIVVGVAWIVSVAPFYLVHERLSTGVELYQLALALIPASTVMFWLRANTKSLLMPALFGASAIIGPSLLPILPGDAAQSVTFWLVVAFLWIAAVLVVFYYGAEGLDRSSVELPPDELPVDWDRIMPKSKPARGAGSRPMSAKDRSKKFSAIGKKSRR